MSPRLGIALALALASTSAAGQSGVSPYAATLARLPLPTGRTAWPVIADAQAWHALAVAGGERQPARWAYARSLIGQDRGGEAIGVLETMRQDEHDLMLVDSFRIAFGAALTLAHRDEEALAALLPVAGGDSAPSAERCAWRLRALVEQAHYDAARTQVACATPAVMARSGAAREPFTRAIAEVAVETGRAEAALAVLSAAAPNDLAATLLRARAEAQLGHAVAAQTLVGKVEREGNARLRAGARLAAIENGLAAGTLRPDAARQQLAALSFGWRGDAIEERARGRAFELAVAAGDHAAALAEGATLLRYFDTARRPVGFKAQVQQQLDQLIGPASTLPLPRSASLLWDYRDIVPSGAEGNQLIEAFATRLIQAGLYQRAADLLDYQLRYRTSDVAQGPLSARVATLLVLSGRPADAVALLRTTARSDFTPAMNADRQRVQAIALAQLGRVDQALAILAEVPDSAPLRAEILWKQRRWADFVRADETLLPPPTARLNAVEQTIVLRHAIALAMLGRNGDLSSLHQRYGAGFEGETSGSVFRLLTGTLDAAGGARLERALAALPSASPVEALAPLLDAPASPRG